MRCNVQVIRSLPETDDRVNGILPAKTIVARDNLLVRDDDDSDEADEDPWRQARVLSSNVYKNAAPYLLVSDASDELEGSDVFNIKDKMRMHPVDEAAVTDIACAALDMSTEDSEEREDAVMLATAKPDKVRPAGLECQIGNFS
jgi:hypothetical protein